MKIITLQFNPFVENTYIVYDPQSLECAIIDPGMSSSSERKIIESVIEDERLKPVHLLNTHLHVDHLFGNEFISSRYSLGLEANEADTFLGEQAAEQAKMFGLQMRPESVPISVNLKDGDVIKIGEGSLKVLEVPGHSPGSLAFYDENDGFVITGDALFAGSIGRTDLPGGSTETLLKSIAGKLFTLPDDTRVYPGHGPATTIAQEKQFNPYF